MTYEVQIEGVTRQVAVREHPEGGWWVAVDDGPERHVTGKRLGAAEWLLSEGNGRRGLGVHVDGDRVALQVAGHGLSGTVIDPRDRALDAVGGAAEGLVATPMPGVCVRVLVEVGAVVMAGDVLVVVEAMKMENEYKSPVAGTVQHVHVEPGQALEANASLITVEPH